MPQFVAQIEQSVLEGEGSDVDVGSGHGGGGAVHQPGRRGNAAHQYAEMYTSRHAAGPAAGGEAQACITNRFVGEVDIAQTTKTDGLAADASVLEGLVEALAQEFTQAIDVGTLLRVEALHGCEAGRHAYRISAECAGVHHRPRLARMEALHQGRSLLSRAGIFKSNLPPLWPLFFFAVFAPIFLQVLDCPRREVAETTMGTCTRLPTGRGLRGVGADKVFAY